MLMLEEFKKNIKFFVLMALVLTLLMSAGVSLFNFSFEINKKVYETIDENFIHGYEVTIDGFLEPAQKLVGVDYYHYKSSYYKYLVTEDKNEPSANEDNNEDEQAFPGFFADAYSFEDYLPKNFIKAAEDFDNFLLQGNLWTKADNNKTDGKYPIFISDRAFSAAAACGIDLSVGNFVSLTEKDIAVNIPDADGAENVIYKNGTVLDFVIKGIYKRENFNWKYNIPDAVIPVNAEIEYRAFTNQTISCTYPIINSLKDFKKFSDYANKNGISYYASIEEDMKLVSLFSSVFAVISIAILVLSALIAFVYCGMFINKRLNFIGLIKAMGMSDSQISKQFFVLLLIVFGFAYAVGNIFSFLLTSHFANLALTLFEYNLNTGFNPLSQLIFGVLTALVALFSVILLYRRIRKISISQVLAQKE